MSVKGFIDHLAVDRPAFRCVPPPEVQVYVLKISHRLGKKPSAQARALMRSTLGNAGAGGLEEFYLQHDGALLYTQPQFGVAGLRFFPIKKWLDATKKMDQWVYQEGLDYEGNPIRKKHLGIAFGEVPGSANYFAVHTQGKDVGKIFFIEHDDSDSHRRPIAKTFDALLLRITKDPAKFFEDIGAHVRYSDGKSGIQWIPQRLMTSVPHSVRII